MSEDHLNRGRTAWDFASDAMRSRVALLVIMAVFLIVPMFVHFVAEPGSEISLFSGLIKYQKAKRMSVRQQASKAETPLGTIELADQYKFPTSVPLDLKQPTPLFDNALNVRLFEMSATKRKLAFGGPNIALVRAAARTHSGDKLPITPEASGATIEFAAPDDCYIEMEYKGLYFALRLRYEAPNYRLGLHTIPYLTMQLRTLNLESPKGRPTDG